MAEELSALEDEVLLDMIGEFHKGAFSTLVQRHTTRYYRIAYRTLYNKADAEDVVQESFLKIWDNPAIWSSKKKVKFTTWFYKLVVNRCLDMNKKKSPISITEDWDIEDGGKLQSEAMAEQQEQSLLEQAIESLPERQKTALNLCFYEELSNKEAADIMGLRVKALESLLMRAKASLKDMLALKEKVA